MAWVCQSTAVLLHNVSTVRACLLHFYIVYRSTLLIHEIDLIIHSDVGQ